MEFLQSYIAANVPNTGVYSWTVPENIVLPASGQVCFLVPRFHSLFGVLNAVEPACQLLLCLELNRALFLRSSLFGCST